MNIEYHDGYDETDDLPEDIRKSLAYVQRRVSAIMYGNHGMLPEDVTVHIFSTKIVCRFEEPWDDNNFISPN
jgi:hypothetical protein